MKFRPFLRAGDRNRVPPLGSLRWARSVAVYYTECARCTEPVLRGRECWRVVGNKALASTRLCRWCGPVVTGGVAMVTPIRTFRFTVTLGPGVSDVPEPDWDELTGRLLRAGCDDSSLRGTGGSLFLDFDREAGSLGDAIASAVRAVEWAGLAVTRVDVLPVDTT